MTRALLVVALLAALALGCAPSADPCAAVTRAGYTACVVVDARWDVTHATATDARGWRVDLYVRCAPACVVGER